MNIKKICRMDIARLSELYVRVFKSKPWNESWNREWAVERLSWFIDSPGFYGFYLEIDNQFSGAILGNIKSFLGEKEFDIGEFFVDTQLQGQGIGKKLLAHLESVLKEDGVCRTTLITGRSTPAHAFYKKSGYQTVEDLVFLKHELRC